MMRNILFLFALFFIGCFHVGPDFAPPEVPSQQSWEEHLSTDYMEDLGAWWENYHDETLNAMVDFALQQNFNLEAAGYRILAARANLGFAVGEYFPQTQQLEGSKIRTHISANAPNSLGIDRDFVDNILGLRVMWELDFWGRFYRGVQGAYGEFLASQEDYKDVVRLLISDLVLNYVQYKTLIQRIETFDRNIEVQFRSVEITKTRFEGGLESELDYAQAVSLWKETIAQKVALEITLKQATTSIAILLGLTPEELYCYFSLDNQPLHIPDWATVSCPAEILYQRPDLRRSLDLIFAQNARVGVAVSDLFPRISLTGFIGFEAASDNHDRTANQGHKIFFSRNSLTYFYGADFVWPILNYGRLESRIMEQYAILNEGIAAYRNQVLVAFKEVEDAMTFFVKSLEETGNLEESFKAAKRSVDISTLQYQEGIADYSRVLNSLQLQLAAEDSFVQARGNIGLAYAAIYRALGVD